MAVQVQDNFSVKRRNCSFQPGFNLFKKIELVFIFVFSGLILILILVQGLVILLCLAFLINVFKYFFFKSFFSVWLILVHQLALSALQNKSNKNIQLY